MCIFPKLQLLLSQNHPFHSSRILFWTEKWRYFTLFYINQTSIAPISPVKPGSVAWQPNQFSTAKSRKQFRNINRPWRVTLSMGERPNQRDVSRYFLKVANKLVERTDSGRLFQRDGAREWKALAPVLVLTLGTDKLLSLFDLSEREGIDEASMEWR